MKEWEAAVRDMDFRGSVMGVAKGVGDGRFAERGIHVLATRSRCLRH